VLERRRSGDPVPLAARDRPLAGSNGLVRAGNPRWPMRSMVLLYALMVLAIVVIADLGALGPWVQGLRAIPFGDKVAHLALAAGLGFGAASMRGPRLRVGALSISWATPFVVVVATLEELSQQFIPSRSYDLADLAADFVGIAVGTALAIHRRPRAAH
jgi:VanZ family protein